MISPPTLVQYLRTMISTSLAAIAAILIVGCASPDEGQRLLNEIRESTIVPKLGSYNESEQREATRVVREAIQKAPEGTAEILAQSLRDPILEDRTKLMIAYFLSEVGDERGLPVLIQNLGVDNPAVQDLVKPSIARYGLQVVPQLIDAMQTSNDTARQSAVEILIQFRSQEVYDTMWERYGREPHGQIRFLLLCGFAEDERVLAERRLLEALADKDELVREHAWAIFSTRTEPPQELPFDPSSPKEFREAASARLNRWYLDTR